ncbi:hypothetical protein J437_LFUL001242 [Ladona fulva]|uniref:Uncharacterized protein n=1 Tax=Ladona fulva TaxID=123851 RepID=A0A8K0JWB1_LADFU|nr:hypothetical protein J437_LFUL001242 [Ladona fulva]
MVLLSIFSSFKPTESSEHLHERPRVLRNESYIEEDVPYRARFWKCSLPIKVVQLVASIMCAVMYHKGSEMMPEGPRRQMPNVSYYGFALVNIIEIVDYLVVQKIPGHGIRMLGFLGGVLFMVAGTISIETWAKKGNEDVGAEIRDMLVGSGSLAFFNALLYFFDTVMNCKMWIRALCSA